MNEAELLLSELTEYSRPELYLNREDLLGEDKGRVMAGVLKRRLRGEPIQYILGSANFFGLEFKVTPAVLIPRPETELLVEKTIEYVTRSPGHQVTKTRILDIGTGCGNIAISLAKNIENCEIIGIDISKKAIAVAKENAALHGVNNKIDFMCCDFFSLQLAACDRRWPRPQRRDSLRPNSFDFIVSNPPYIESEVIDTLQPEVRHEPRIALDGGKDGMDFYRRIISEAPEFLASGGYLILEIGFNQRANIEALIKNGKLSLVEKVLDHNNQDRILVVKNG